MKIEVEIETVPRHPSEEYNDRDRGRNRDRNRTRERCLTPRMDGRRYQSPNSNSGTRKRSTSRVPMNRNRVRCYKCIEYDHFANECPNSVTDDSVGYESDRAALQLIASDTEIHQNYEETRPIKEQDHLNL